MGRGRSGAGNKTSGGVKANSFPSPSTPLKASQLPTLTGGTYGEINEANNVRKAAIQYAISYAVGFDSQGNTVFPEIAKKATFGTKQEQFAETKNMTAAQAKERLALNKDINARYKRVSNFVKSSPNTVDFWISYKKGYSHNQRVDQNYKELRNYIDGKTKKA